MYILIKMTRYATHVNQRATPQRESARADQVRNNAGGFVFSLDKWAQLDRFLILGSEGGTYYASEKKLTQENAQAVAACLVEDGLRAVARIVEISDSGRAPKNDPAIFALAMAAGTGGVETRKAALNALPKVCRIGTHLFGFAESVKSFRGWGPALCRAVSAWYTERDADKVAYDLVKYQARNGWSHSRLIKLSHPKAPSPAHKAALTWSARGGLEHLETATGRKGGGERGYPAQRSELPAIIEAMIEIHSGVSVTRAADLIAEHRLPHECVPNELKSHPVLWGALSAHMGPTALMRNLNKMTAVGLIKPLGNVTEAICKQLTDQRALFKARVHPLTVLTAMRRYAAGRGDKGSLKWTPVQQIVDALDETFYLSFEAIEPTGKRHLMALDVSGSMSMGEIAGSSFTPREGSAAMAMATVRSEKNVHVTGFTHELVPISISRRQRLDDVIHAISGLQFGRTDCAQPMLYAMQQKLEVDCFSIYTDNETWFGSIHPFQALRQYRERTGILAKLVVVGMTATEFSIADPTDAGMLDVVGFDSAAPAIIADFSAEREVHA